MRQPKRALRLTLALAIAASVLTAPGAALAQSPTLELQAPSLTVPLGHEVVVEVVVSGASDLYGVQVEVGFDAPAVLQVRDADGNPDNGIQVAAGELLQGAYQGANQADNISGAVSFAASLLRPAPPISEDGSLVRIAFEAVGTGSATVTITEAVLVDTDGNPIDATIGDSLTLTVGDAGWIVGRVLLQGRTDHSGATVYADGFKDVTDGTGAFSIAATQGSYTVRTDMPRYLDAQKDDVSVTIGETTGLATVKLPAGDANDDGVINIIDLAIIARAFGSMPTSPHWDERADINGDGWVNICDFVLAASNFGRCEPVYWP